jgi:hypothetical protein
MASLKITTNLDAARVDPSGISVKAVGDPTERFVSYSNVTGENVVTFNAPNDGLVRNYQLIVTLVGGLSQVANFQLGCSATPVPVPLPVPAPQPIPTPTVGPVPQPTPQPTPQPVPVPQPVPTPQMPPPPEPTPQPVPVPQPVPTPQMPPPPEPTPQPVPVPQPVPTPQMPPPPEPTPQPVPVPVEPPVAIICEEWINSTGNDLAIGSHIDCSGQLISAFTIAPDQSICARQGTIQGGEQLTFVGPCTETPTPTPQPGPVPVPVPVESLDPEYSAVLISPMDYSSNGEACLGQGASIELYKQLGLSIIEGVMLYSDPGLTIPYSVFLPDRFYYVLDGAFGHAVQLDSGLIINAIPC